MYLSNNNVFYINIDYRIIYKYDYISKKNYFITQIIILLLKNSFNIYKYYLFWHKFVLLIEEEDSIFLYK